MYFFFQAEDGIRDRTVTGVQTCALPICSSAARLSVAEERGEHCGGDGGKLYDPGNNDGGQRGDVPRGGHEHGGDGDERSEERRVGKEGGKRWAQWDGNEKREGEMDAENS